MLAYRKSDFDSLGARAALREWAEDGVIDAPTAAALLEKIPPPFHTPNLFIRIGLFIFGSICAAAAFGLFFVMGVGMRSHQAFGVMLLVFAAVLTVAVEMLIRKEKPFFRAGLEEAFLYGALLCLIAGLIVLLEMNSRLRFPIVLFAGCILAAAALRYADSFLAALAWASAFYALFDLCSGLGDRAGYILPLLVISLSACAAYACGGGLAKAALRHWEHVWQVLRFLALLTCYAGGNYFVIRELGHMLFHQSVTVDRDIPFAPAFYAFTFGLPLAYTAAGLVKKDRLFLHAGLVTAAFAVFTYKYYHHVLSVEAGLALAGIFLIATAWIGLRLFRTRRFGLTAAASEKGAKGILDAESLAMLQGFASKDISAQSSPEGLKGGGGGFGGGGADGTF
ncbi:MAG: hypothetical protein JWO30_1081 [Fibrobacteres bacterium]|nr:hypothetical protein [Fibrobacterota bacterium]